MVRAPETPVAGRDYRQGTFFVTVCTYERGDVLGTVTDGRVALNDRGEVVARTWASLPARYPCVVLDDWCIMPDHLHGILVLAAVATPPAMSILVANSDSNVNGLEVHCPPQKNLGSVIGAFKTMSAKEVNLVRGTPGRPLWQRGYWERVVRMGAIETVREYIRRNPERYAREVTRRSRVTGPHG